MYLIVAVVVFLVVVIVFIVCSVSFIICLLLCALFFFQCGVFCLSMVCYLCVASYCLIVPLPPGKTPFAV
jgi:hypothetical protein